MIAIRKNKQVIVFVLVAILSVVFYVWFSKTPAYAALFSWAQKHILTFIILLVIAKIVSIIWPPIPGGLLTLSTVPLIGWQNAFFADFVGSMLGGSIAYFIGMRYGFPFLRKFFDSKTINKLKHIKIRKHRELEAIFALKILGGSIFTEAICYGAGLIGVRYKNFLIGSAASHVLVGVPLYYSTENLLIDLNAGNIVVNVVIIALLMFILYKLKGRYFE